MKKRALSLLLAGIMCFTSAAAVHAELIAEDAEDIVEISMYGLGFFGEDGLEEVMDKINEISEEEIGVHVNYHIMDIQTYATQLPLMLISGDEPVDLIMDTLVTAASFQTLQAQGQLMDISGYLEEYAPEMTELMTEYLPAMTVNGQVFGVPCYREYNSSFYIIMRKDILDELGLTEQAQNMKSWNDLKVILQTVHDSQDQLPSEMKTNAILCNSDAQGNVMCGLGVNSAADPFEEDFGFDTLGSSLIIANEDGTVENFFATEDYRKMIERTIDFYNSDLIYKDSATSQDSGDTLISNGISFACTGMSEIGIEQQKANSTGYEVVCVPYADIPIQTSNGNAWGWSVPVVSEEPEAAVQFMNLMYTNPEIENLFVYGIEGRDYELNEEGEAVILADTKVYQNSDFFFGNQFNAYPAAGQGADFRQKALESLQNAAVSPFYGCVVDTDPIANELTAITTVLTKYKNGLESGSAPIDNLDSLNQELNGAGLETYLNYYQEQLSSWIAEN